MKSQKTARVEDNKFQGTGTEGHLLLTHKTKVEAKSQVQQRWRVNLAVKATSLHKFCWVLTEDTARRELFGREEYQEHTVCISALLRK